MTANDYSIEKYVSEYLKPLEEKGIITDLRYKEKETGEPDGAEIIGLKPKRRFSACQKIRQPKRKDLGIY